MKRKKKHIESEKNTSEKEKSAIEWERVAQAVAILFLIILALSSFFPTDRLWGVNHLSYYPLWFRGLLIFLGFLAFIPFVNQNLQRFLKKYVVTVFNFLVEKHKYLGYSIIILLFILFFYLFRTRTHFLGDGASLISYMNSGTLFIKWSEPLARWIYLSAYDLLNRFFHFDGFTSFTINGTVVFALISYLCGVVFIFFALRLANLVGKTTSTKLFVFLSLTFMGGTELFLGYAEFYPLLYCGILIYLFYSIKCLSYGSCGKGETKTFLPLLIFFILLPTHFFSLYLFPSAIFLFLSPGEEGKTKPLFKTKKIWMVSAVLVLVLASLVIYFREYGLHSLKYFLPLFHGRYPALDYTLFSPSHLLDFLNQQLLVSPIGFSLFLIFLILRPIGAKRRPRHAGGEGLDSKDKIFQFLLLVSIPQLLFNFMMDTGLGAARDWDLFASVGLGYTLLALYLFSKVSPNPKISYLKLSLTTLVFISTLPWMGINASADLSLTRFRNLLDLDLGKSRSGHYVLAYYFKGLGNPEEMDRENRMMAEKIPEASLINDGWDLLQKKDFDNAYLKFSQALQIAPDFAEAHWSLGEFYIEMGDLEKAEVELMKAIDLKPEYGRAYADLGILYGLRQNLIKAQKMLKRAIILGVVDKEVYYNLGSIYLRSQNIDQAIRAFQKAIRMNDEYPDPHLGLAQAFFQQRKLPESLKEANTALQIKPDFARAYYQLGMVYGALGNKKESVSALRKYLELEPTGPLAKNVEELIRQIETQ